MTKLESRKRFSNMSNKTALTNEQMTKHLTKITGGWPKVFADQLSGINDGKVYPITKPAELFADIDKYADVSWRRKGRSKEEFLAGLALHAERFDGYSECPHFPSIEGVYYTQPAPNPQRTGALDQLIDFYNPATKHDRSLIQAAFMTPFWGGAPGQRPVFCITTKDGTTNKGRGKGKSTLAQHISELAGGYLSYRPGESNDSFLSRLLSPGGMRRRIVIIDNLKSYHYSSALIESLITEKTISGKRMYFGEGSRPNYLTILLTVNGPSFSKDVADRSIVIKLAEPKHDPGWGQRVTEFMTDQRDAILSDIAYRYAQPTRPMNDVDRWAAWEQDVLSRASKSPDAVFDMIVRRRRKTDNDREDAAECLTHIRGCLAPYSLNQDPDKSCFEIPTQLMRQWVGIYKPKLSDNAATQYVKQLQLKELVWKHTNRGNVFIWTGTKCKDGMKPKQLKFTPHRH